MSFCMKCGKELEENARFCTNCGNSQNQNNDEKANTRKNIFEGVIHKCPNCGEVLNAFDSNCSSCGYEIRDSLNSKAFAQFTEQLLNADSNKRKVTIIRNFPIPNTKEDILEFMILTASNIEEEISTEISEAWCSKIEQINQKAKLVIKDETELAKINDLYCKAMEKLKKGKRAQKVEKWGEYLSEAMPVMPNILIVVGWLITLSIMIPLCNINQDVAGTNSYQFILILDLIAGAVFIPLALKCSSHTPRIIVTIGLILSIITILSKCGKKLDSAGTNAYQLILIIDIVCTAVIIFRMFKTTVISRDERKVNGSSLFFTVITIILLTVAFLVSSIIAVVKDGKNDKDKETAELQWPQKGLALNLPEPSSNKGEIHFNEEDEFWVSVSNCNLKDFEEYVEKCVDIGFTVDKEESETEYEAYNNDEFYLCIDYSEYSEEIDIKLTTPRANDEINWPTQGMATMIPKPNSTKGKINIDTSIQLAVDIGDVSQEEYKQYVEKCIECGFDVDYSKSETVYSADNKDGDSLRVEFEGHNIMSIYMYKHDE